MIDIKTGEIIQIIPEFKAICFAGCLAVVCEVKETIIMCYIQGVGATFEESAGQYYLRLGKDDFERTGGIAPWIVPSIVEEQEK